MLSNYVKYIQICDKIFALYNSLVMDVLYVDNAELNNILNGCIEDNLLLEELYESGIYIGDEKVDREALQYLQDFSSSMSGNVDILYVILSQDCNLKCSYCFLDNNPNKNTALSSMSFDYAKLAINKFYSYISKSNIKKPTIVFYGGEPLITKQLFMSCVEYAASLPVTWVFSIITNGTLLDNEVIQFCLKYKITIGLSVDGPEEIHDKNRRYKKSNLPTYHDCMEAKAKLDKIGCQYGLSMVVSEEMIENKQSVYNWLFEQHRGGDVFFNLLHFSSKDSSAKDYIIRATDFLIEFYEESEKKDFIVRDGRIQRQIDSISKQKFCFSDCGAVGCHQFTILPNGNICICHGDSVNNNYHIGNIRDIDISSIIDTEQGNRWGELSTLTDEECLDCEAVFCCGRGCPHHAENLNGSRESKDTNYCNYVKAILYWLLKRGYKNNVFKEITQ